MDETILLSYLKGEASQQQCLEVETWAEASSENLRILEQLYYVVFLGDRLNAADQIDVEKSLTKLKSDRKDNKPEFDKKQPLWRKYASIAAAFFIGILFAGFLISSFSNTKSNYTFLTGKGERAQVVLPDGTKVWLNSSTHIKFKPSLFGFDRQLDLNGEAYFEVEPDKYKQFIVTTNNVKTYVLGTKFNIRYRKEEQRVVTSLLSGSVKIGVHGREQKDQEYLMKPGEVISVNTKSLKSDLVQSARPEDILLWIDGKLNFRNSTLSDITRSLERHFDVKFSFQNSALKGKRFTCEFDTDDDIDQILKVLSLTNQLSYEKRGREISLTD